MRSIDPEIVDRVNAAQGPYKFVGPANHLKYDVTNNGLAPSITKAEFNLKPENIDSNAIKETVMRSIREKLGPDVSVKFPRLDPVRTLNGVTPSGARFVQISYRPFLKCERHGYLPVYGASLEVRIGSSGAINYFLYRCFFMGKKIRVKDSRHVSHKTTSRQEGPDPNSLGHSYYVIHTDNNMDNFLAPYTIPPAKAGGQPHSHHSRLTDKVMGLTDLSIVVDLDMEVADDEVSCTVTALQSSQFNLHILIIDLLTNEVVYIDNEHNFKIANQNSKIVIHAKTESNLQKTFEYYWIASQMSERSSNPNMLA